jgi:hypothetical protein
MKRIMSITIPLFLAISLALSTPVARAATSKAECPPNSPGIVSFGAKLFKQDTGHLKFAIGHWTFITFCPPLRGGLDLRLQIKKAHDVWETRDVTNRNVSNNLRPGQKFTMIVSAPCGGEQSWRLRLYAEPGLSGNGDPYGPAIFFYPDREGKQLDCK